MDITCTYIVGPPLLSLPVRLVDILTVHWKCPALLEGKTGTCQNEEAKAIHVHMNYINIIIQHVVELKKSHVLTIQLYSKELQIS